MDSNFQIALTNYRRAVRRLVRDIEAGNRERGQRRAKLATQRLVSAGREAGLSDDEISVQMLSAAKHELPNSELMRRAWLAALDS